ncbi:Cytochrome c oxidase, subunit Vb [Corchorus capsularis]|uniref:(6-4)DNA photolyase n=1 Tax=Corchorus capsularis TaxID=210143 RepID=A0A1R3G885_COCAP|nr:Cytochrome c oxidase, subunit Vb [Corchorus capsularis]
MASGSGSLMWFRKGLRIHDNPALEYASRGSAFVYPLFVIDPHYMEPDPNASSLGSTRSGINRIRFLLESLVDLDLNLKKLGSRLLVLKGEPGEVLIRCLKEWDVKKLCFEYDTDPYYQALSNKVKDYASSAGIEVFSPVSHTLFNPADIIEKNGGKPPLSYQSFLKLAGEPSWASSPLSIDLSSIPPVGDVGSFEISQVPTLKELGYMERDQDELTPFRGGESEALRRLKESLSDKEWVANFEKPKGDPSAFTKPATTILSPYLKFGCLSSRYFYQCLRDVYKNVKKHTSPPVSLVGQIRPLQLLWREFFYTVAFGTPNFDKMKGNKICKQIPWNDDDELLAAWREARTGYPWIDAIMVQLRKWGWMHHLARHCVACFLTRGDMFIHWEKGRDVFERLLIDSDWAINNGNWLWLSCSSFFYQYNRIYSPISFGRKYDPNGNYIRHFLPVLKDMPKEYIYEPWTAPLSVQTKAKCIIGKDYPKPVVSHDSAIKECRRKMGEAYALNKKLNGLVSEEDLKSLRRKLVTSQLKTLATAPCRSAARTAPLRFQSHISPSPAASLLVRHFSAESVADTAVKKKVEDVMPIATGHEREELEAELQGKKILEDVNFPVGPFGTKEAPAVVKSYYDKRIVGCPGGEGEDEHDVVWFWLEKGKPHECPVCSQYFVLEVVGPGGPPDGHGDDDHH